MKLSLHRPLGWFSFEVEMFAVCVFPFFAINAVPWIQNSLAVAVAALVSVALGFIDFGPFIRTPPDV